MIIYRRYLVKKGVIINFFLKKKKENRDINKLNTNKFKFESVKSRCKINTCPRQLVRGQFNVQKEINKVVI